MVGLTHIHAGHWIGFLIFVLIYLAIDLGLVHRTARVVPFREALFWTCSTFCMAIIFAGWLIPIRGVDDTLAFFTGYLVELSLSFDNVFVIAVIFAYFGVPRNLQHKVLFWGLAGAIVMRGAMILGGLALLERFHWLLAVMGVFLIITSLQMVFGKDEAIKPERNFVARIARRFFPVVAEFHDGHYVVRIDGRRALTPLALVLITIETSDLIFALDSIPAIFSITSKPFILFTSNVFAILGLRSMYFLLAGAIDFFRFLKAGLSAVLIFMGAKMLLGSRVQISTGTSLVVVIGILSLSIAASLIYRKQRPPKNATET